jgi:hypothetical protein
MALYLVTGSILIITSQAGQILLDNEERLERSSDRQNFGFLNQNEHRRISKMEG